jgi:isocitrate dehydrogenase
MTQNTPITVARGDGIGPEIMDATLRIIKEAGAHIEVEEIEVGEKVYLRGINAGIEPGAWESLRRTKVFLKAPITTPQGGGYKSLNVTTRVMFGLYANVRPAVSYYPFVDTKHPEMDVVIIRENIMKLTDGLFHKTFDAIAAEYPDILNETWIVDIGAAKLADTPEAFDVVVLPNLYGDILSDVAAQIAGSVGLAGSANIGDQCAMFEAIHGSAPRRAGQNIANPSGLLLAAVMMLVHIDQPEVATRVHNAWLRTIEDGIHTYDIYVKGVSKEKVGTKEFADAIIARLGQQPQTLKAVNYKSVPREPASILATHTVSNEKKDLVGVDIYLDWHDGTPEQLGESIKKVYSDGLELKWIANRGAKVWPHGLPETFYTDHWRCRFMSTSGETVTHNEIVALLQSIEDAGFDFIKIENLYNFDGHIGYSLIQGE